MASLLRYRSGETKPRRYACNSLLYPIEKGDLLFKHPADNTVRPASAMLDQGSKDINQQAFRAYFAGVAMEKAGLQPGETSFCLDVNPPDILVATGGVYEFDCPSQRWVPGQQVGVFADTTGCQSQQVDAVTTPVAGAIGQAVLGRSGLTNAETRVMVEIDTTVYGDGLQAAVAISGSASGE